MTDAPRLTHELTLGAARLRERAAGYRFTGERRLATLAVRAADDMTAAAAALTALKEAEAQ